MDRAKVIFGHLAASGRVETQESATSAFTVSDDDVVICAARRTPLCKASRGKFKDTLPDDLLGPVIKAVIQDAGIYLKY